MNEVDSQSLLSVLSRCSSDYIFVLALGIGLPLVRRIARKAFEESNVLTCGVCNHNLQGLTGDALRCPECGTSYDRDRLQEYWRWHHRHHYWVFSDSIWCLGRHYRLRAVAVALIGVAGIVYGIPRLSAAWHGLLIYSLPMAVFLINRAADEIVRRRGGLDGCMPQHWDRVLIKQ